MPRVHNQLTRGPWTSALKAALGDSRNEGGIERFGETMQPVVDLWRLPEWAFLRDEVLAAGQFIVTSAAGTLSEALLLNPTDSNVMAVITKIHLALTSAGAQLFYRRLNQGTLPAGFVATATGPVDFRNAQLIAAQATRCIVAQAANAAADGGIAFDAISLTVNLVHEDTEPIILGPGSGLVINVSAVGVNTMVGGFRWRERQLFGGELE